MSSTPIGCRHTAGEHRLAVHQQGRADPTRTKTARRRFAQHLRGRWDAIKFHINRGLVENDALGLEGADIGTLAANVDKDDSLTPGAGQFDFPADAEKAEAFADWLDEAIEQEILEEYGGDRYLRQGYSRGVRHADARLREQGVELPEGGVGAVLQLPVHRDKLDLLYTRAFDELDGITQAAAQEIRRELVEGLAQGQNPRTMARNINDRVEAVGKTRSTVLARTEVVRAHAEGTLDRYERIAGDVGVTVQAEWITAQDQRVCAECAALEGRIFSIDEARGLLPLHPQCRCAFVPVPPDQDEAANVALAGQAHDAPECQACEAPLAVVKSYCIHCEFDMVGDIPTVDLREMT